MKENLISKDSKEDIINASDPISVEVSKKIWEICKISPDHGNMIMDLLGESTYDKIAKINMII